MIETELERIRGSQRAAETDAAEQRKLAAPLDKQPHHFEEVFVPAHRDAVFGDAPEARHHPLV